MQHLVTSARRAIGERNLYAALAMVLTFPDICGRASDQLAGTPGGKTSKARYVAWCDQYLKPQFTVPMGRDRTPHAFLTGDDTYALRCAVLHEGSDSIVDQRARAALDSFMFTDSPGVHCNQFGAQLQLDVSMFCEQICRAVDSWVQDSQDDPGRMDRVAALMKISNQR